MSKYGDWRLMVYDRSGFPLAELEPISFLCVWSIVEQGTAEMILSSRNDPKCTRANLMVGNFVEFRHARLGQWVGVIIPHDGREGSGTGALTIRMRDATFQFARRRSPVWDDENNEPRLTLRAGKAIDCIVRHCNIVEDTRLRTGDVHNTRDMVYEPLFYRMFSDIVDHIIQRRKRKLYLWGTPARDENNLLIINVNLVERKTLLGGSYIVLQEDINLETPSGTFWRQDGELVNDVLARNEEDQEEELILKWRRDAESIGQYGVWQGVTTVQTDEESVVEWWADEYIKEHANLNDRPSLTIFESEEQPEFFNEVRAGKVARVLLHSQNRYYGDGGFDELVQLVSLEYETNANRVIAVPELVKDVPLQWTR
jgi:hypothetical protein